MKHLFSSSLRNGILSLTVAATCVASADVWAPKGDYDIADRGYIASTVPTASGILAMSSRGSDISLIDNGVMRTLVASPGAGMYVSVSADGRIAGFKSINGDGDQAPALLEIATGRVTLLEDYVNQCGQVSFAEDGTMAYTMGNTLIVRNGDSSDSYDLGRYVNIANISPDGTHVAYTDLHGSLNILSLEDGETYTTDGLGACRAVWSPDNSMLAVGRVNGTLYSMDAVTRTVRELGAASSFSWCPDSRTILVTRSEMTPDYHETSAEVIAVNADGSGERVVAEASESIPVSVACAGSDMIVSYATGALRGVSVMDIPVAGQRQSAPAKVRRAVAFSDNERVGTWVSSDFGGYVRPTPEKEAIAATPRPQRLSGTAAGNDIGLYDIPYINQVWDTPYVNGSVGYGYVCCAPSSACMLLGYLGLVPEHEVTSRSPYAVVKKCMYSWYVSKEYTSPQTGTIFNVSASGNGTTGVKGGYGWMWGDGNSPYVQMGSFYRSNGIKRSYEKSGWDYFVEEAKANRPYTICLKNGTNGHVVLGFRVNQQAAADGSVTFDKVGSFICNDPYGNYNGASYPNWDGRAASYDWPGYNNGVKNIQVFYWGYWVSFETEAGVSDIVADSDADAPVEMYDLRGVRVDADAAAPGVYIRRQGTRATKVLVR